jgi:hypothetical protein
MYVPGGEAMLMRCHISDPDARPGVRLFRNLLQGEGVLRRKAVRVFREWLMAETAVWRHGA